MSFAMTEQFGITGGTLTLKSLPSIGNYAPTFPSPTQTKEAPMNINRRLLAEADNALLSEFSNCACEMDHEGDVWDSRGYWWNADRKRMFLDWLDERREGVAL
jgi:hypothetical protein